MQPPSSHLRPPGAVSLRSSNGSGSPADALKLMIRRERSPKLNGAEDAHASRPSMSSDRSVQFYEADTADVRSFLHCVSRTKI